MRLQADNKVRSAYLAIIGISILFLGTSMASAFEQYPPVTIDMSEAAAPTFLNTSPLFSDAASSSPACNVVNISSVKVALQVDLIDSAGSVLYTSGTAPVTINPGKMQEYTSSSGYSGFSRCRFTVYANPAKIRANLAIFHYNGYYNETLASDDAR